MKTIYIGDIKAQEEKLRSIHQAGVMAIQAKKIQMGDLSPVAEVPFDLNRSIARMKKRVDKHFGLNRKYAPHQGAREKARRICSI